MSGKDSKPSKDEKSNSNPSQQPAKDLSENYQQQINDLMAALQRERADAINLRRRTEEEKERLASVHKAAVVRSLLPIIDNFERALKHIPKDLLHNDYIKGIQSIVKQFDKVLDEIGVKRITTVGSEFNPELHEAVSMDDSQNGSREVISEELQAGYLLGNEVIRHAMVKVQLQP